MTYTVMKTDRTNYINNTTNEITTEQAQAMKWYNEGAEVAPNKVLFLCLYILNSAVLHPVPLP